MSFLFQSRDGTSFKYLTCTFRGLDFEGSVIHDVEDAQLRRWKSSDWWPKE